MKALIIKRLFMLIPTALMVSLLSFCIIYFSPGNAAEMILSHKNAIGGPSEYTITQYEKKLNIDKSFTKMFSKWSKGAVKGDFGTSFKTGISVSKEFLDRVPCTLMIVFSATFIYLLLGFLMGIFSALFKDSIFDHLVRIIASINLSIPNFWMALLLIWFFAVKVKILPAFGYEGFKSIILPSVALGIGMSSSLARVIRSCILDALESAYVFTARSKGLGELSILVKHVLKNILLPIITLSGTHTAGLIGGSVIIENIFGLPGVGNYLLEAISLKDFPVISGFVFFIGSIVVLINLFIDLSYVVIDPRVRRDNSGKFYKIKSAS